jgi:rhodanese-related sulfurtransferase
MLLYIALALSALALLARFAIGRRTPEKPRHAPDREPEFIDLDGSAAAQLLATTPELVVLDVRSPLEFAGGHLPKARSLPLDRLESELDTIPREAPLLVYCAMGARSAAACTRLAAHGFRRVYNLESGIHSYPAQA